MAVLLQPNAGKSVARSPNKSISVSIGGVDAATHEWVRGEPGSFEEAKNAVRNMLVAGIRLQILMTLLWDHFDQGEAMIRKAEELNAPPRSSYCNQR